MDGRIVELEVTSAALAGNPLGDPDRRLVLVYLPAAHGAAPLPAKPWRKVIAGSGARPSAAGR